MPISTTRSKESSGEEESGGEEGAESGQKAGNSRRGLGGEESQPNRPLSLRWSSTATCTLASSRKTDWSGIGRELVGCD